MPTTEIKRCTKKTLKELELDFYKGLNEKKRRSTYYAKFINKAKDLLEKHNNWVNDKIEKEDFCQTFNEIGHDVSELLEDLIESFERAEGRRNWTTADYDS